MHKYLLKVEIKLNQDKITYIFSILVHILIYNNFNYNIVHITNLGESAQLLAFNKMYHYESDRFNFS